MIFITKLRAIDPEDGELKTYAGPNIKEISWTHAEEYCKKYLPYCIVEGILHSEIDEDTGKETIIQGFN